MDINPKESFVEVGSRLVGSGGWYWVSHGDTAQHTLIIFSSALITWINKDGNLGDTLRVKFCRTRDLRDGRKQHP